MPSSELGPINWSQILYRPPRVGESREVGMGLFAERGGQITGTQTPHTLVSTPRSMAIAMSRLNFLGTVNGLFSDHRQGPSPMQLLPELPQAQNGKLLSWLVAPLAAGTLLHGSSIKSAALT